MSRNKKHTLRSALYNIERSIPYQKTQINEWERDLIATAACAIWDNNTRKVVSCLRRLMGSPERSTSYAQAMAILA